LITLRVSDQERQVGIEGREDAPFGEAKPPSALSAHADLPPSANESEVIGRDEALLDTAPLSLESSNMLKHASHVLAYPIGKRAPGHVAENPGYALEGLRRDCPFVVGPPQCANDLPQDPRLLFYRTIEQTNEHRH
jgi:hypothetical protein